MTATPPPGATQQTHGGWLQERANAGARFFAPRADELARLCHRMAERFARRGRLLAVGVSPAALSDVRHVAVEFVHPVIVGKRALPAVGLVGNSAPVDVELALRKKPRAVHLHDAASPHARSSRSNSIGIESASS